MLVAHGVLPIVPVLAAEGLKAEGMTLRAFPPKDQL